MGDGINNRNINGLGVVRPSSEAPRPDAPAAPQVPEVDGGAGDRFVIPDRSFKKFAHVVYHGARQFFHISMHVSPKRILKRAREIAETSEEGAPEVYEIAAALRVLMAKGDNNVRYFAMDAYGELSAKFSEGAPEVYKGAKTLRALMAEGKDYLKGVAADAYGKLSAKFKEDTLEVYAEAKALRALMAEDNFFTRINVEGAYGKLSAKFKEGAPEVYAEAKALRALMAEGHSEMRMIVARAYVRLSRKFAKGAPEVYKGAKALRALMVDEFDAAFAYCDLSAKFKEGTPEAYAEAKALRALMVKGDVDGRYMTGLAYDILIYSILIGESIKDNILGCKADVILRIYSESSDEVKRELHNTFKSNFYHLSHIGFFRIAFSQGTWIDRLGLSKNAALSLHGFAGHHHFIDFFESIKSVLNIFSHLSEEKRMVLNAVLEATDSSKWKSVRNTLSTFRALQSLDALPKDRVRVFYRRPHDLSGDPRAALREAVEQEALEYLREKVGGEGRLKLLFMPKAPAEKEDAAQWRVAQTVRKYLADTGLLALFASAASFMNEQGLGILKSLLEELAQSAVADGVIDYRARYERMVAKLGFSSAFVEKWKTAWRKDQTATGETMDAQAAQHLVARQAVLQLRAHVGDTQGKDGPFEDLPTNVRALIAALERTEVDRSSVEALSARFKGDYQYQAIRQTYGDIFANIRTDLKNLVAGLTKGIRVAKCSESIEITGRIDALARHGMVPVETCQRLTSESGYNADGRPLNKLLWGQFKVANYIIDNEVMARRIVEATRDAEGFEHLLVERMYTAGGFAKIEPFDAAIVAYAEEIGIAQDRVHFLDRHDVGVVPLPLKTGAEIYRDSHLSEIDPAVLPASPLPASAAIASAVHFAMPAPLLRTGTYR